MHTPMHPNIYIYIERERERERDVYYIVPEKTIGNKTYKT